MNSRKRSGDAAEAGSAAVEAALIMSALLLAVVGAVETARAMWTYNTMLIAVEQAGRYAMMYNHRPPAICQTQTQALQCPALSDTPLANCSAWYAQQVLTAYRTPSIGVSVAVDTTTSPPTVTVCASHSFNFIAPHLLRYGPLDLTSSVTVPMI
jgi:Flp pilus assembly protein TadG